MAREDGVYREKKDGAEVLTLVADGVEWQVPPLNWEKDFPAIANYVALKMLDPIDAMMEKFDRVRDKPQLQKMLVELAYRDSRLKQEMDRPTDREVQRWMDTHDGTNYVFYTQLIKVDAKITLEKTADIVGKAFMAEARKRTGATPTPAQLLEAKQAGIDASNPKLAQVADALRPIPSEDVPGKMEALNQLGVKGADLAAVSKNSGGPGESPPAEPKPPIDPGDLGNKP